MKNSLKVSLEAIDFQSRDFGEELAVIFDNILGTSDDAVIKNNFKAVEELTFKRTGIRVKIKPALTTAAVNAPIMNMQGVLLSKSYRDEFYSSSDNYLLKRMSEFRSKSFIDTKKARVGGFFSTIECDVLIGVTFLKLYKLSGREVAALYLHELGHIFTEFEFISHTVTTNQALACIANSLKANNNKATTEHVYIVKEVGKIIADDDNYFQEIFEETNAGVITTIVVSKNLLMPLSNMRFDNYDDTASESTADAFVTRFGFGTECVSAAHKIENRFSLSTTSKVLINIASLSLLVRYVTLSLNPLLTLIFTSYLGIVFVTSLLVRTAISTYFSGEKFRDFSYDKSKIRYLRIREQAINALKDSMLDAKEKEFYLNSIKSIDEYVTKAPDDSLAYKLSNYLFKSNRDLKRYNDLQRELEVLASNDIFNKAAELSLMK